MKKLIPNMLVILLFMFIAGLFIYDYIILKKPIEDNIIRIVLICASLVVTLIKINKINPERPLWFYEKVYGRQIKKAFEYDKKLKRKLLSALKILDEKNYYKAKGKFEKLLPKCKEDVDFSVVYFFSGVCLERMGLFDEAKEKYELAIDFDSENVSAYNNLASYYQDKGDLETAIVYYKKAIGIDGEYINAYSNISGCYLDLFDFDNAKFYAEKAFKLDPSFRYAALNLAVVYAIEGDEEKTKKYSACAVKNGYTKHQVDETIFYYKYYGSDEKEFEEDSDEEYDEE